MAKNKLIYTVGLQASGKTTWAREMIKSNPEWVQVELDEIRMDLGMKKWSPEIEKTAQLLRDKRILTALRAGKTVISSDTNISESVQAHLQGLALCCGVKSAKQCFLHVPLDECISRDKVRGEQGGVSVGEAVIRRTYSRIR